MPASLLFLEGRPSSPDPYRIAPPARMARMAPPARAVPPEWMAPPAHAPQVTAVPKALSAPESPSVPEAPSALDAPPEGASLAASPGEIKDPPVLESLPTTRCCCTLSLRIGAPSLTVILSRSKAATRALARRALRRVARARLPSGRRAASAPTAGLVGRCVRCSRAAAKWQCGCDGGETDLRA